MGNFYEKDDAMTTRIFLRKVLIDEALSSDSTYFTCTVYFNGKLACHAQNNGRGGNTVFAVIDPGLFERATQYAQGLPHAIVQTKQPNAFFLPMSLELLVNELVEKAREEKWLRQQCRTAVLWRSPDMPEDDWVIIPDARPTEQLIAEIMKNHSDAEIANLRFTRKNAK